MASDPITIKPAPKKGANITAGELIDAVIQYLKHMNIEVERFEFEASPASEGYGSTTQISFHNVRENGEPWAPGRYIFCDLDGKAFKVLTSRLGHGPFELLLCATITYSPEDENGLRTVADLIAEPNADRSISFHRRTPQRYVKGGYIYEPKS